MKEIPSFDSFVDRFRSRFTSYETREQQETMWHEIKMAFEKGEAIAIEAPTGTGKTYGYSVPVVYMLLVSALTKKEHPKVVLSTYTISLQEQLIRDLEVLQSVYNEIMREHGQTKKLQIINLKGVSNYFCELRFQQLKSLLSEQTTEKVEDKLKNGTPRTKQDIGKHFKSKEWEQVKVDGCQSDTCPFYHSCDYAKTYESIGDADITVTNHAVYFYRKFYSVDAWDGLKFVVFGEAHKLEKVILHSSSEEVGETKPEEWLEQGVALAKQLEADAELASVWKQKHASSQQLEIFRSFMNQIKDTKRTTFRIEQTSFSREQGIRTLHNLGKWAHNMYSDWVSTFLTKEQQEDSDVRNMIFPWYKSMQAVQRIMDILLHRIDGRTGLPLKEVKIAERVSFWFTRYVYEQQGEEQATLSVHATRENFGDIGDLFPTGTVFTSGTLAQNGSCNAFTSRILYAKDKNTSTIVSRPLNRDIVLSSPFDLPAQTKVHIHPSINPKVYDEEVYFQELLEEIPKLLTLGTQKSFVLFTSSKFMWRVFRALRDELECIPTYNNQSMQLWIQTPTNYKDVIRSFQDSSVRSILFGLYTYFEGVDLKKDSLTQVILTRLPYSVPDDPIQEILSRNHSYSDWEALIRYEQAYGRLIRTLEDYGMFHVLDKRALYLGKRQFVTVFQERGIPLTTDYEEMERFYRINR